MNNYSKSAQDLHSKGLWSSLSKDEKEQVSASYHESESQENLVTKGQFLASLFDDLNRDKQSSK